MRRRKAVLISAAVLAAAVIAAAAYTFYYINDAKNYMKHLSVDRGGSTHFIPSNPDASGHAGTISPRTEGRQTVNEDSQVLQDDRQADQDNRQAALDDRHVLPVQRDIVNILFLGLDRTEDRDSTMGVYRTDTIIMASINLKTKKAEVLSIPRDTYVYMDIIGKKDKINHAYVWGGMGEKGISSTIDTVNRLLKYSAVDYYFTMDMEPVANIVDDLGGVEVDVDIDIKYHGADLSKGRQLLNGSKAFEYINWRYTEDGDIGRVRRQQKFLKAVFEKLKTPQHWMDAAKIVLTYDGYIKTNLSTRQIISLAALGQEISGDNTTFHMVPGYFYDLDGISYWMPEDEKLDGVLKQMFSKP